MYRFPCAGLPLNHREVRLLSEDLRQVRAKSSGRRSGVELGLHDDLAAHDVQGSPNRNIAEVSAFRQQGRVISSWFSSSFTAAVIAMRRFSHAWQGRIGRTGR